MGVSTGASFTGVTMRVKVTVFDSTVPSSADTIMIPFPLKFSTGVNVRIESVMDAMIFSVVLTALKVNVSPSISVAERVTVNGYPCRQEWFEAGEECANYCCNPDDDVGGEWCKTGESHGKLFFTPRPESSSKVHVPGTSKLRAKCLYKGK